MSAGIWDDAAVRTIKAQRVSLSPAIFNQGAIP